MLRPSSATAADEAIKLDEGLGRGLVVVLNLRNGSSSSESKLPDDLSMKRRRS